MKKYKRKKFTIVALKLLFWLSMGADALLVGIICSAQSGSIFHAAAGLAVMAAQIIHGVRICFFDKTVGNMLPTFCIFQFILLSLMSLMIVSKVGWVIFAVTLCQLAAALIVLHRHRIAELAKKIFYGWI